MSQEPFGDIPLFREIQRILASSEGPVNLEIARQVATAIAQQGGEASPTLHAFGSYSEAVRTAELLLAGYTRLQVEEATLARTLTRSGWVSETLDAWRWLLELLARRFSAEVERFAAQRGDEANVMQAVLGQIASLLFGIQAGTLVGYLAKESLGRYDPLIPRDDEGRLFLVTANVESVIADYDFELESFVRWLALHDMARHLVIANHSWINRYFRSLFAELAESLEIDTNDLERRLAELQEQGPQALQAGAAEQILPTVPNPRHTQALDRLRAFVSVLEGYARHAAGAVGEQLVGDATRIEEGIARYNASSTEGKTMLAAILGLSFDRALSASGTTFCAAVVKLKGMQALNQVWSAPDNLPTLEEIADPFSWIERVLEE